jgi:hypothetical protein
MISTLSAKNMGRAHACPVRSQMRIMNGIGTPISQSRQERMVSPIKKHFSNAGHRKKFPPALRSRETMM